MIELKPTNLIAIIVPEDAIIKQISHNIINKPNSLIFNHSVKILGKVTKEGIQFDVEPYLKIQPVTYHEYTPSYQEWIEYEYKDFMNEGEWFGSADYKSEQYSWESLLQANNVVIPDGKKLLILEKL